MTESTDDPIRDQTDDTHRAIGRYIDRFSRLVFVMRDAVEQFVRPDPEGRFYMRLILGEMPANPIAQIFFALCTEASEFNKDDEAIRDKLLHEIIYSVVPERNDIAHGDWWIGWATAGDTEMELPIAQRVKLKSGITDATWPAEHLDARSDRLKELRNIVGEFGWICFGKHPLILNGTEPNLRVSDIFVIAGTGKNKQIKRKGPKATGEVQFA